MTKGTISNHSDQSRCKISGNCFRKNPKCYLHQTILLWCFNSPGKTNKAFLLDRSKWKKHLKTWTKWKNRDKRHNGRNQSKSFNPQIVSILDNTLSYWLGWGLCNRFCGIFICSSAIFAQSKESSCELN